MFTQITGNLMILIWQDNLVNVHNLVAAVHPRKLDPILVLVKA